MILDFYNNNYLAIWVQLYVVVITWIIVLVAIILDFISGIRKAKQLKEARTSKGYRRTINKLVFYYSLMTFGLLFDCIDVITPNILPFPLSALPLFTIFSASILVFTEYKSVKEKAEDKERRKVDNSFIEIAKILSKREDLLNIAIDALKEEKQKQNNDNQL